MSTEQLPDRLRAIASLAALLLFAALAYACSSDGGGGSVDCGVGDRCACDSDFDCPDFSIEHCVGGVCVSRAIDIPDVPDDTDVTHNDTEVDTPDEPDPDTEVSPDILDVETGDPDSEVTPVGPCAANPCDANATCTVVGDDAFTCACNDGFEGNGETCTDIDECADEPCDENATCTNTPGSFSCDCDSGFIGDGFACSEAPCVGDECPTINPWVAYVDTDARSIYFIRADGTARAAFDSGIDGEIIQRSPVWSPDGQRLAYIGFATGDTQVMLRVVDVATGNVTTIDSDLVGLANPSWSPDGTHVVVEARENDSVSTNSIYRIRLSDGDETRLTTPPGALSDSTPVYDPSGGAIYFVREVASGGGNIQRLNLADSNLTPVTNDAPVLGSIKINATGTVIAHTTRLPTRVRLFTIASSSGSVLSGTEGYQSPTFFPDGQQLAVVDQADGGGFQILIIRATNGSIVRTLTQTSIDARPGSPNVSPIDAGDIDISAIIGD